MDEEKTPEPLPMAAHKALLLGASAYDDHPRITSLPFVPEDLQRLADALSERGFASAEIPESPRGATRNFLTAQLTRFLRGAGPGDRLLVVLSGHGMNFGGDDYLIPEDAVLDMPHFEESCVRIDWSRELEQSPAAQVVFLVDACREGIAQDTMSTGGPPGMRPWGDREIAANLRRKVAYVYACSPGELALYVGYSGTTEGETFSLFSRAVCEVVKQRPGAVDLAAFETAVRERVSALRAAYARTRPPQTVRVLTDVLDKRAFPVLPGPTREAGAHAWVRSVTRHAAWDRVPETWRDEARARASKVAERLAEAYEEVAPGLRADPWHDAELAERTSIRTAFLVGRMRRDEPLSPTEAALIALLPLASQALWARETAALTLAPSFVLGYPRLNRRLEGAGPVPEIEWWLRHRAALRRPEVYAPDTLKSLLGEDGDEGVTPDRLIRLLKDQRSAPFGPPGDDLTDGVPVAPSTAYEHEVRERLVAALTKTGHALAIDPVDLPEVVVEHVGISDSVDLTELLRTVRKSEWIASGVGRALSAVCAHPAVQIALQEHAGRVDGLLRALNGTSGKHDPVASLPPFANPDRVRLGGNTPPGLSSGIRFHLAEDRVQELLIGEDLYGDAGLAVRELYQNALDACRYREARTEYLVRSGAALPAWEGRISFTQGVDEQGRPYLDCADNGIGMGVEELSHTFSQGGSRFVDLPEYVEESAEWSRLDPPVELHPNSRFGIGVLSYFMLADEITVHTCRLDREGRPGRELRVTIAGPGNLFRVEDVGPGEEAGTRVRLHLTRRAARRSCVDQLLDVLWVAEYATRAVHGSRVREWEPGVLCGEAVEKRARPGDVSTSARCHPSSRPDLWWSQEEGLVLADGLAPSGKQDAAPYGIVANLTGRDAPRLSVNRRETLAFDADLVRERALDALPSLFAPGAGEFVVPWWLHSVSRGDPEFADAATVYMDEHGIGWSDDRVPFTGVGLFLPDSMLWPLAGQRDAMWFEDDDELRHSLDETATVVRTLPEFVLRGRLGTLLHATGTTVPVPPWSARPSDLHLLTGALTAVSDWEYAFHAPAAHPDEEPTLRALSGVDWLDETVPVPPQAVFQRVGATRRPAAYVTERLRHLGYEVEPLGDAHDVTPDDLPLLRPFWEAEGWLAPGGELPSAQLSYSAAQAGVSPREAADRLRRLGFRVPGTGLPRESPWSADETAILNAAWDLPRSGDGTHDTTVPLARVVQAAHRTGHAVGAVHRLLREAGFRPDPRAESFGLLSDDDNLVLSEVLPLEFPVPIGPMWHAATLLDRPVKDVGVRLRELGHSVPDPLPTPWTTDGDLAIEALRLHARLPHSVRRELASGARMSREALIHLTPGSPFPDVEATARLARLLGYEPEVGTYAFPPNQNPQVSHLGRVLYARTTNEESPAPPPGPGHMTLRDLALAAARSHVTLREAAKVATELGIRHDIEDWFA
ncbi:hypothetical protein GCM10009801_04920 [Streptomyces albiaxialis]|uniref:Peptidase C14 caspase catalytic subunit p20 n=1 Tax=Streptomyces albiaxialis TaxID=329523 RepID=A0ABN2VGZ6_9ACTN